MEVKTWVTLDDVVVTYRITEESLHTWIEKKNIPTLCLNGKLFIDENILKFYLTRDKLLIPPPPGNKEEQQTYESVSSLLTNETFLHLHLLNSDAPLTRLFCNDIQWLIPNIEERIIFDYVILHHPFDLNYLLSKNYTLEDINTIYRKWVKKISDRIHSSHKSRQLASICTYEIKTKNHILTRYEKEIARLRALLPDERKNNRLTDEIKDLLNTPIENLPFDGRIRNACWATKHTTLGDLLTTGRNEGYSSLIKKYSNFGATTLKMMVEALRKMGIIDKYGYSYLYFYLPLWKKKKTKPTS